VDYLERLLKEHGIDTDSTESQRQSMERTKDERQEQDRQGGLEEGDQPRDLSLDHLVGLSQWLDKQENGH
jgi:hypothetical protein